MTCFDSHHLLNSPEGSDFKDQQDPPSPPLANRGLMLGTQSNCLEAFHGQVHMKAKTQPLWPRSRANLKTMTSKVEKGAFDEQDSFLRIQNAA